MHQNYHWATMLDPVELADGVETLGFPSPEIQPVEYGKVAEVSHHGRKAWEADLRPLPAYDPRCSCCLLLFSAASQHREAEAGASRLRDQDPQLRYADAHRVRLDVATGVCVYPEELGGTRSGQGHDVRIEAADEEFPDQMFVSSRRRWWRFRKKDPSGA